MLLLLPLPHPVLLLLLLLLPPQLLHLLLDQHLLLLHHLLELSPREGPLGLGSVGQAGYHADEGAVLVAQPLVVVLQGFQLLKRVEGRVSVERIVIIREFLQRYVTRKATMK